MGHVLVFSIIPACARLLVLTLVLERFSPRMIDRLFRPELWTILSVGMFFIYAIGLALSLYLPATLDFVEANVASVAYLVLHHHPLYVGLLDTDRYSLLYGPLCYLPYSFALKLLGPTLTSLKIALCTLTFATFLALWLLFRRLLSNSETLIALALIASAFMMKSHSMFMVRGDILLLSPSQSP